MGRFGKRALTPQRAGGTTGGPVKGPPSEWLRVLPDRFEAVGEGLAAADSERVRAACWVVGRDLADVGTSLGESIEGLRTTTRLVADRDPTFDEMHSLTVAWSEATLAYLHGLSCADPLTGLSSMAHLRDHLAGIYRDQRAVPTGYALVVVNVGRPVGLEQISAVRRLALAGEATRAVFGGSEAIGRVGADRVVVVAERNEALGRRVTVLRRMLPDPFTRVWIEGLPGSDASAAVLLDELARGA
jgi:hypothetical protein